MEIDEGAVGIVGDWMVAAAVAAVVEDATGGREPLWAPVSFPVSQPSDWIWSMLDPTGNCTSGATGPCVWREPRAAGALLDICGDRHCTGAEGPESCPTDCVTMWADSDSDGLPDIRDLCPARPLASGETQHADTNSDLIGDACFVEECGPCAPDPDADRIAGTCDNCPDDANADQADCDGNGVGDACEILVDPDGDGLDSRCGADNCPDVANPDQANCNLDAELANGVTPLGDACDPTPCGDTLLQSSATRVTGVSFRTRLDRVVVDARAVPSRRGRTGYRFCPCDAATEDTVEARSFCANPTGTACVVGEADEYGRPFELRIGWRDATVGSYERGGSLFDLGNGLPLALSGSGSRVEALEDYATVFAADGRALFETDLYGRWALRTADEPRWGISFLEPTNVERRGVFWTHTPGPATGEFAEAERDLASHYWSGVVERDLLTLLLTRLRFLVFPRFPRQCWVCGASFPETMLAFDPSAAAGAPLVAAFEGGMASAAVDLFRGTAPAVDDGLVWLGPAESAVELEGTDLRIAAVDATSMRVVRALEEDVSGRFAPRGAPPCDPQTNPNCIPTDPFPTARAAARAAAPQPDPTSFVLAATRGVVYSLTESGLFVLGADGGEARFVETSRELGTTLAATYSAFDRSLYVLDEVRAFRRLRVARLLRVDPETGEVQPLGAWLRLRPTSRFALASAAGGALWLAASGRSGGHLVALVRPEASHVRVLGVDRGRDPLASSVAHASVQGLTLVVQTRDGEEVRGHFEASVGRARGSRIEECF